MTRQDEFNAAEQAMQLLAENGMDGLAEAVRILLNEAMRIERSQVLNAGPYERTEERSGHANGYKPKTVSTRVAPDSFRYSAGPGRWYRVLPVSAGAQIAKRAGAEDRHCRDVCARHFNVGRVLDMAIKP